MKITLLGEHGIRLDPIPGPMTIEADSPDQLYSPFHMFGSSVAFCTYSVLVSWASNAQIEFGDIAIEVRWTFAEEPHRVGEIVMNVEWPSLPGARRTAASRVADLCAIHATLINPPTIRTVVEAAAAAPA